MVTLRLLVVVALPVLGAALVVALSALPSPWDGLRPATCMPDGCFCERIRDGFVRQPANTLSGLLFVPVGAWILLSGGGPRPAFGRLLGAATIVVGVGTAFYHASLTFAGQTLDVLGMYLLVTVLLLHAVSRRRALSTTALLAAYAVLNAGLLALLLFRPGVRREAFAALVVATLAMEGLLRVRRRSRTRTPWLATAAAVLALGFAAWLVDLRGTLCDPGSLLQGHALWHAAGALAAGLVFLHLRADPASIIDDEEAGAETRTRLS